LGQRDENMGLKDRKEERSKKVLEEIRKKECG
jgi:hypothetical protein